MSPCSEYSVKILRSLENGLRGQELGDFRNHLEVCPDCRAGVEAERELSRLLLRSRPLYSAPSSLRTRVSAAVQDSASTGAQERFYRRVKVVLEKVLAAPTRSFASLRVLVPALVMGLVLAFLSNVLRQVRAANYVETAVAMHRSYLDGSLPVGLRTTSPEQVTAWLNGKIAFPFRLPNAQMAPDSIPAYRLTGASLVNYRGSPAGLVTYEQQNGKQKEKISLLVASSESAVVAGGYEVRSGTLTFHYRTDAGFKVITWSNHGLSYALVSSVSGSARESCLVCHQSMADQQNFRPTR